MKRQLPEAFCKRMRALLGEEAEAFFRALGEEDAVRGLRVNRIKTDPETVRALSPFPLSALPYAENGFCAGTDTAGIGNLPLHHAGMVYLQDPGAMATVCAVNLQKGARAVDFCAAPGGKASQIAEAIGEDGFLLANEVVPKRAKILLGNFERLGIRNAVITSLGTAEIARLFYRFFDLALVDAPCSGEGMFRKSEEALAEWSEENILACARRQQKILDDAEKTVAAGGKLLYSTCTWSLEENEMTVDRFLREHPAYHLVPVREELCAVTADGIVFDGAQCKDLALCRRFYPHKAEGEGQFIALMERDRDGEKPAVLYPPSEKAPTKEEKRIAELFLSEVLEAPPRARLARVGENLVLLAQDVPIPAHAVFSTGVLLGQVRGKNLFPSHQFFSAYGASFRLKIELSEREAERYLLGEELPVEVGATGFCAVTYHGAVLGGGKISCGKMKNHYPKGLRNHP